jgi:hypothetical protein
MLNFMTPRQVYWADNGDCYLKAKWDQKPIFCVVSQEAMEDFFQLKKARGDALPAAVAAEIEKKFLKIATEARLCAGPYAEAPWTIILKNDDFG